MAISRANYAAAVGQNPGDLAPEPSLAALLPATVDQAFDVAGQANGQIRAAEYNEQASRARLAAARAERMPNLAFRGTAVYSGAADPLETETFSRGLTGSAVLTVPLFSGGLVDSRVRAAVERNNVDKISIETARRSVMQGITQSWSQLTAARANIGSTETQVRASTIAAEGTRQEQQVGLRTTLDVLNAEQELRSAQLSQVNSVRDEYVASVNVLGQMGQLEASTIIPNVPRYDPKTNFGKLRITWGWVPWEEPIALVDGAFTPHAKELPKDAPLKTAK